MATWTDELKKTIIAQYLASEPTADNTSEIIKDLADEHELSPNGVRMVLVQAGAYIKKEAAAASTKATGEKKASTGGTRVSKEAAINELRTAIEERNAPVDDEILTKLTGKAAVYLLSVLKA